MIAAMPDADATEALAAKLRQLAHAERSRPAHDQRNAEALGEYLAIEGRKIADLLGIVINDVAIEFLARQTAWTLSGNSINETRRLNATLRRRQTRQKTF